MISRDHISKPSERAKAGENVPLELLTAELRANIILTKARSMALHQRYRDAEDQLQLVHLLATKHPDLQNYVQAKIADIKEMMP